MGDSSAVSAGKPSFALGMELASLRVGTAAALLLEDSASPALVAVFVPAALRTWPEGLAVLHQWPWSDGLLEWLLDHIGVVDGLVWGFRLCMLLCLVGVWTRWSLALGAVLGAILLPLAQLVGPTVHNLHLFWFLLLLASAGAASGAVWSLDAVRARRRAARSGPFAAVDSSGVRVGRRARRIWATDRARVAVASARLILAVVYFFPGYWKLRASGFDWFGAGALTQLFHSKWYQFDFVPWLRVDRYPALLSAGGASIVLLELAFPLLVLTRRGRTVAFSLGLTFHVLSSQLLGIGFAPLWLCYGVLVDWPRVDAWLRGERPFGRRPKLGLSAAQLGRALGRAKLVTSVGALAALGLLVEGVRGVEQGWPWACYPTFRWIVPDVQLDVLAVVGRGQAPDAYPPPEAARRRSQREWGRMYFLLGAYGDSPAALERARCAYAASLVAERRLPRRMPGPTTVDLYEVLRPTAPERWDEVPKIGRHLASCAVP